MTTQPKATVIATANTYTSGIHTGQATKVALSATRTLQGWQGRDRLAAPQMNWTLNDLGARLAAIEGMAAMNYGRRHIISDNNAVPHAALSTRVVGAFAQTGGGTFEEILTFCDTTGKAGWARLDAGLGNAAWTDLGATGLTSTSGRVIQYNQWLLLWDQAAGLVKRNQGIISSWTASGTTTPVAGSTGLGSPVGSSIVLVAKGHAFRSSGVTPNVWTDVPIAALTGNPVSIGAGESAGGVLVATDNAMMFWSYDGTAWTQCTTTRNFVSVSYSPTHKLWAAMESAGELWYAPDAGPAAPTFTRGGSAAAGTCYEIRSFGQYWLVAGRWGLELLQGLTTSNTFKFILAPATAQGFTSLTWAGGRLVVVEQFQNGSAFESFAYPSLRAPFTVF